MKATIFAAAIAMAMSATTAFAMDMKCDDASMAMMKTDMMKVKDESMKKMATDHMMMAADSMKAGKMDDCMMHMKEAEKAMGKM